MGGLILCVIQLVHGFYFLKLFSVDPKTVKTGPMVDVVYFFILFGL